MLTGGLGNSLECWQWQSGEQSTVYVGQSVLNDGVKADSPSDREISLRTLSNKLSLFGENLMS